MGGATTSLWKAIKHCLLSKSAPAPRGIGNMVLCELAQAHAGAASGRRMHGVRQHPSNYAGNGQRGHDARDTDLAPAQHPNGSSGCEPPRVSDGPEPHKVPAGASRNSQEKEGKRSKGRIAPGIDPPLVRNKPPQSLQLLRRTRSAHHQSSSSTTHPTTWIQKNIPLCGHACCCCSGKLGCTFANVKPLCHPRSILQ